MSNTPEDKVLQKGAANPIHFKSTVGMKVDPIHTRFVL